MFTKEKFYDKMLDAIVEILESYVNTLNELIFVLKYQPDKPKAFFQANKLMLKCSKVNLCLTYYLIRLINQYLTRL